MKDAPSISEDGHLSPEEETQLYRYYGIGYGDGGYDEGRTIRRRDAAGRHAAGGDGTARRAPATGATGTVTGSPTAPGAGRRPRHLGPDHRRRDDPVRGAAPGRHRDPRGRPRRLRKHVVTEHQQVTVPVSHEEVTLEREPITDANRGDAYDGPAISEEEHEVTLRAERPVVDTEAVAVERVRLGKETVTDQETVGGEVRKEEIELDRDGTVRDGVGDDLRDEVRTDRR